VLRAASLVAEAVEAASSTQGPRRTQAPAARREVQPVVPPASAELHPQAAVPC
jgi:hypothetical protein